MREIELTYLIPTYFYCTMHCIKKLSEDKANEVHWKRRKYYSLCYFYLKEIIGANDVKRYMSQHYLVIDKVHAEINTKYICFTF